MILEMNKIVLLVLHISVAIMLCQTSSLECPSVCKCKDYTAVCKSDLNYISKLPEDTRRLIFIENNIESVNKQTFTNLTTLNLETLIMGHNKMSTISHDAFSSLIHLRFLDLSGNGLVNINEFAECLSTLNSKNITKVKFNLVGLKTEPTEIYKALSIHNIMELSMSRNFIQQFSFSDLGRHLPYLIYLNVAYNNIQDIHPAKLQYLENLQLHHNFIDVQNLFETNGVCNFPNLKILNLTSNFVNYFENRFSCLDKLEILVLDRNPVKQILNGTFENLESLQILHLNSMGDRLFNIEGFAFRSQSLKVLSFSRNNFPFITTAEYYYFDADHIFSGIPNLEELDLSENYFNLSDGSLKRMLSKLNNLTKLTIKSCKFRTIPSDIFSNMSRLIMLNLTRNHISSWNGTEVFGNISSLQTLRLDHNYINVFNQTSFPESLMTNLTTVNMAMNPFFCSCKNLWFRKWIDKWIHLRPHIFSGYPDKYICNNPPELAGTELKDYFPSDSECINMDTLLHAITSLSIAGIIFVMVISLVYKARWHIRYWIYLQRSKREDYISVNSGDSFLYSGFVVYCDDDRDWVINKFLKIVEEENGQKLCIHHRDFEVGRLIVDNIAENIAQSRKVVLILSKDMVQSDWCRFETRLAHRRFLNKENESLIIIMLENIQKKNMPNCLGTLISMTTYIMWSEEPYIQERFWTMVLNAMKESN